MSVPAAAISGRPGVGSVSISTRSRAASGRKRWNRRQLTTSIAARSAAPSATRAAETTCAPVASAPPKKRPSRASGAAWCRIDPYPDCELGPLNASRAPRNAASELRGSSARTTTALR